METELLSLGIASKHSRPYHPQTCGKVERFHQTLKKWLTQQDPTTSTNNSNASSSLRHLLQPATPPPSARPTHTHPSLHRPRQSLPDRPPHQHQRLPRPPRQDRQIRPRHPPLPRPPPPHRHRQRLPRLAHRHAHRRARDQHPRPRRQPAPPAHPRPHQGLPTHPLTARNIEDDVYDVRDISLRCLATSHRRPRQDSNLRPPSGNRPCYDHSRDCGSTAFDRRVGGARAHRRVFPRCQRSFPPSAVFAAVIPCFCCRAAVDRPRVPSRVAMTLDHLMDQAARAKSPLALLFGAPF